MNGVAPFCTSVLTAFAAIAPAHAATVYVTDDLVLTVYADKTTQSERVATLHSGASLELLEKDGDYSHIQLAGGAEGWVKSAYLTEREPAAARVKLLEEKLAHADGGKPTTKQDAGPTAQIASLQQRLQILQAENTSLRSKPAAAEISRREATTNPAPSVSPAETNAPRARAYGALWIVAGLILAAAGGFAGGYATLARRVRQKFGGVKVY